MGIFDKAISKYQDAKSSVQNTVGYHLKEDELRAVIPADETILSQISQVSMVAPVTLVATNKRVFFFKKGLLKNKFADLFWNQDVEDLSYAENLTGGMLIVKHRNPMTTTLEDILDIDKSSSSSKRDLALTFEVKDLRKEEAQKFYRDIKAIMNDFREVQRVRDMEEKRAVAGGTLINMTQPPTSPGGITATSSNKVDRLREIKQMLDEGLITQSEFDEQKARILQS